MDLGGLAGETGVSEATARTGLESIVPRVLDLLKEQAGGAEGLLTMLAGAGAGQGAGGALGRLAGSLFKR